MDRAQEANEQESEITQNLEQQHDRDEGDLWACNKSNKNAWDCLVLSLGMLVCDAYV